MADDFSTLFRCGITAAHSHFNIGDGQSHRLALLSNSPQWQFKILRHIDAKRLQRRNIQHFDVTLRFLVGTFLHSSSFRMALGCCGFALNVHSCGTRSARHKPVKSRKERTEGFTRPSGRHNEHVLAGMDGRPRLLLGFGGPVERMFEPCFGRLRKQVQTFAHTFDYRITVRRHSSSPSTHSSTSPG